MDIGCHRIGLWILTYDIGKEGNRTLVKQFTVTVLDVNESTLPVVEPEPFDFNATLLEIRKFSLQVLWLDTFIELVEMKIS